jgi:hypothetical protein
MFHRWTSDRLRVQITESAVASATHSYIACPMQGISPKIDDAGTSAKTNFRPSGDNA